MSSGEVEVTVINAENIGIFYVSKLNSFSVLSLSLVQGLALLQHEKVQNCPNRKSNYNFGV